MRAPTAHARTGLLAQFDDALGEGFDLGVEGCRSGQDAEDRADQQSIAGGDGSRGGKRDGVAGLM